MQRCNPTLNPRPSESSQTIDVCEPSIPLSATDARDNAQNLELQGRLAQVMQWREKLLGLASAWMICLKQSKKLLGQESARTLGLKIN